MSSSTKTVRLNKFLADCGVASRRKADHLILGGHVKINGHIVKDLATQILIGQDRVQVDGRPVQLQVEPVYIMFHKPEHMLTTMSDPAGRPTVGDLLKGSKSRLFPVGRLDWDTEGLLLLTNDGDYAQKVAHPKTEISKTYMAKIRGQPTADQLQRLKKGVTIPGGRVRAEHVERIRMGSKSYDWILIVISEGKNRQVRHMFQKIGHDVQKLRRVAIGGLRLGKLRKGEFQVLSPHEAAKVFDRRYLKPKRLTSSKVMPNMKRKQSNKRGNSRKSTSQTDWK